MAASFTRRRRRDAARWQRTAPIRSRFGHPNPIVADIGVDLWIPGHRLYGSCQELSIAAHFSNTYGKELVY